MPPSQKKFEKKNHKSYIHITHLQQSQSSPTKITQNNHKSSTKITQQSQKNHSKAPPPWGACRCCRGGARCQLREPTASPPVGTSSQGPREPTISPPARSSGGEAPLAATASPLPAAGLHRLHHPPPPVAHRLQSCAAACHLGSSKREENEREKQDWERERRGKREKKKWMDKTWALGLISSVGPAGSARRCGWMDKTRFFLPAPIIF